MITKPEKECCLICKYFHNCKVLIDKKWRYFGICMLCCDGSKNEYAMVVDDMDLCEMFTFVGTERAEQPAEVTEQRRHGHWMRPDDMFVSECSTRFWCSVCGKHANYHHGQNSRKYKTLPAKCGYAYCPNCGAKMDGGSDT